MANEKLLNARLQLKYDSFSNWSTKNPTLKSGEVAIAYLTTVGAVTPGETDTQHPVLFKVGPGAFNDLPWASALAADVHAWAKKSEDEFKTWVKSLIEITDIDAYSKKEVDDLLAANSQADKEYADGLAGNYATAAQGTKADSALQQADIVAGSANGTISVKGSDVAVTGLGTAAYTDSTAYATSAQGTKADSAVQKVTVLGKELVNEGSLTAEEAKTALGLKSAAYEDVSAFDAAGSAAAVLGTASDEATANTVYGAKAAAAKAQSDIDAFFAAADKGDAALDTLKEIQDFLNSDSGTVQTLVDSVAENKVAIEDIIDGTTKVASAVSADVATKASGLDAAGEAAVKAIKVDSAVNTDQLGGIAAADYLQKSQAPGYDDILTQTNAATLYQPVGEYASAAQGAKADTAVQPAALNDYYTKSAADAEFMNSTETDNAIDAKITALNLSTTYEPIGAEANAKAYADSLAGNYATAAQGAKADSALQEITTTENGGLKVTNKNQIDIDTDVVFVFNCGDASTLVD